MIKAIIFDCFGVIYPDTLALVEAKLLTDKDKERKELIKKLRRQSDAGLIARDEFWSHVASILGITVAQLEAELHSLPKADWDLLEYVKKLKKTYKTAILSNVGTGFLERIFDRKRPRTDYFDQLIASGDIGLVKPDQHAYLTTSQRLGVEPAECVFIDDLSKHIDGARGCGMYAILYEDFAQMKQELEKLLANPNN